MCGKIEMEVPLIKYTANYLTVYSEMICSFDGKLPAKDKNPKIRYVQKEVPFT